MKRFALASAAALLAAAALSVAVVAQDQPAAPASPQQGQASPAAAAYSGDAVTGQMFMFFETRNPQHQEDGQPKVGVQDLYNVDLNIKTKADSQFGLDGTIKRQPYLRGTFRDKQQAGYMYDLKISYDDRTVGNWVGNMNLDTSGAEAYQLDGDQALRIAITQARVPFEDSFWGTWYGKPKQGQGIKERFTRLVNGKEVSLDIQEADPMKFNGIKLAKGPHPANHPEANVQGELTYDRETANYFARDLAFTYKDRNGADVKDVVGGSIQWVEEPVQGNVRKGRYEFNLRFNEDKLTLQTDDQMFAGMEEEDLFFAVDDRIPSLTGVIEYEDTMMGESPTKSTATYKLTANKLTEQQIMNFVKLWIVACGPVNDE